MEEYSTVKNTARVETVIERSRFISTIARVETADEAKAFVDGVKKEFPDATHNCYAYITERGGYSRYSDDGEPSGTAGAPILEVIKGASLYDTAIVVTRYFGGVKLGTGGLVRAYSGGASDAVKAGGSVLFSMALYCEANISYGDYGAFNKLISADMKVLSTDFGDGVKIAFAVKKSAYNALNADFIEMYNGKYRLEIIKEDFFGF